MEANMKTNLIDIEVWIERETSLAWCVSAVNTKANDVWLPKAQCEVEQEEGNPLATLTLPESLALEKGLI